MTEQEKGAEDEQPAAGDEPKAVAQAEKVAKKAKPPELRGGASTQRSALPDLAEPKESERAAPEPGGIVDLIKEALPDVDFQAYQGMTNPIVELGRDDVATALPVLKDDSRLDLKFLRVLFGVDLLEDGMDVVYELMSLEKKHTVTIKVRLARDDLKVASVASVWNAANWHERETRDMFGIEFDGHPNLAPLLLPEDMTDHFPLRKDNPLEEITEWQGEQLVEEPVAAEREDAL